MVMVRRRMKAVLNDPSDPDKRLVLLKEDIRDLGNIYQETRLDMMLYC